MERHAMAMKVNSGKMNEYRRNLGEIWNNLTDFLDRNNIRNFSIWNAEDLIFIYCESDDGLKLSEIETEAVKEMAGKFDGTFTWISSKRNGWKI